ncbi:MAG TPA: aminotransferase class V-fold PLP-dependent enzyme [bacterium]|jgi:selenocysteine lyase/cysteine desulfurase
MKSWRLLRDSFPVFQQMHFMDTAHYNPLGKEVRDAITSFHQALQSGGQPEQWKSLLAHARESAARLIGASSTQIALTKNTGEGLNIAANALPLGVGDSVVTSKFEHPINLMPWLRLRRRGVEVRVVDHPEGYAVPDIFRTAIDRSTRVIVVSAVQYYSGHRADLASLAGLAHEVRAHLVVDGIQAVGAAAINAQSLGVDALACGGHKWILATHGAGFLYCSERFLDAAEPVYLGEEGLAEGTALEDFILSAGATRFEVGNANYAGFAGLSAGAALLASYGLTAVEQRVLELTGQLMERLDNAGVILLTPREPAHRLGIVTFEIPDPQMFVTNCDKAGIRVALRGAHHRRKDAVRVSLHAYNDETDIAALLDVLNIHLRAAAGIIQSRS